jgi:predicted nucleotidyltransferase
VTLEAKLRDVLARRTDIRFALLFGSSITRSETARDVDVAVSFGSPASLMALGALSDELEQAVGKIVDLVDVGDASTLLLWEIVRSHHVIAVHDEDALRELLVRVPLEYADLKPYLDREAEGLRRSLGVA